MADVCDPPSSSGPHCRRPLNECVSWRNPRSTAAERDPKPELVADTESNRDAYSVSDAELKHERHGEREQDGQRHGHHERLGITEQLVYPYADALEFGFTGTHGFTDCDIERIALALFLVNG